MSVVGRFRMVVPAATAKPSPKIGQALGPLGINMMNFCKEFNARTTKVRPEVPLQVTLVPRNDRTYKFILRSPPVPWFLLRVARLPQGSGMGTGADPVGNITMKEIYEIARAKSMDPQMIGVPLRAICVRIIGTCKAMGITVSKEKLLPEFSKRDDTPVEALENLRKEQRLRNKAGKRGGKK
eukprot:TRINITY_DN114380_c0_g1_i1.p1 TRINITY_DN114380_c0_g1~~TRINITY_DN114380_c0_g1_i1.p1  ORF type:complete len:182 (-),score=37.57 TRINITY_DN114380_c0_g1_i1:76-621(-)